MKNNQTVQQLEKDYIKAYLKLLSENANKKIDTK